MEQIPKWHSYEDMQATDDKANNSIVDWFESLAIAIALIIIVFVFCIRIVSVSGASMQSTLNNNDRVVVQSFLYTPKRSEVVVIDGYTKFGKPLVKRIIALEGDTITINSQTGTVIVNNVVLDETYISTPTSVDNIAEFSVTVPKGTVFVMGDNRTNSLDSRSNDIGVIDERDILGKVLFRVYPFSDIGAING